MIEKYIENELTLKRWRRFKSNKPAVISSIVIIVMLLGTLCAPLIANNKPIYMSYKGESYFPILKEYHPKEFGITNSLYVNYRELSKEASSAVWPVVRWNPYESNNSVDYYPAPPSKDNLFGTDDRGRDVFARLLYGFSYSIGYAFAVTVISFTIGVILGGVMGFFGGKVDFIGQRFVEIFSTVPTFFLLIILVSIFKPSVWLLIFISSIFSWISISYYSRAEFLKYRKQEFVEAATALGATKPVVIFKHILPNSLTPIITFAPFTIAGNIVGLASLDYLGFGLPVPKPSWGELLAQAQSHFTVAWWLAVFPSICLFVTLTALNLIGDGVRDAYDPKKS